MTPKDSQPQPQTRALDKLRAAPPVPVKPAPDVAHVTRDLDVRTNPDKVAPQRLVDWPWSAEARARAKIRSRARELAVEARLDIFKDDLGAIRGAAAVLRGVASVQAVQAVEAAIFEIRCAGQTARFAILNQAHLDMTRQFVRHLEEFESMRGSVSSELIDALKERALNEFTEHMNRASKCGIDLPLDSILKGPAADRGQGNKDERKVR